MFSEKELAKINTLISGLGINLETDEIEENCGTVWVTDANGNVTSITSCECED